MPATTARWMRLRALRRPGRRRAGWGGRESDRRTPDGPRQRRLASSRLCSLEYLRAAHSGIRPWGGPACSCRVVPFGELGEARRRELARGLARQGVDGDDASRQERRIDAPSQRVDAAFLPRRIVSVDALPREATGKLTSARLAELAERHDAT